MESLTTHYPTDREQEKGLQQGERDSSLKFPLVEASTGTILRKALLIFSSIYNTTPKERVTF
jgi:hypothetical protein